MRTDSETRDEKRGREKVEAESTRSQYFFSKEKNVIRVVLTFFWRKDAHIHATCFLYELKP